MYLKNIEEIGSEVFFITDNNLHFGIIESININIKKNQTKDEDVNVMYNIKSLNDENEYQANDTNVFTYISNAYTVWGTDAAKAKNEYEKAKNKSSSNNDEIELPF